VVTPTYPRVLLKLSGEALLGNAQFGIDPAVMHYLVGEIHQILSLQVQLGLVIGGGNIFRGAGLSASGINRVAADYMGMLATVINSLAMQDALQKKQINSVVMSAIRMQAICQEYRQAAAIHQLAKGNVVIFAAGTGNPLFTTDTAASLRAIEIGANLMIKATKVDGVYSADPIGNPQAQRFTRLTYDEVISRKLGVMDMAAVILCRDHHLPLRVVDMGKAGTLVRTVLGGEEGTLIVDG